MLCHTADTTHTISHVPVHAACHNVCVCSHYSIVPRAVMGCPLHQECGLDVNTASPCDGLTCCVPQLVAGSFQQLDLDSGSDPLQLTACSVSSQPALAVQKHPQHAYGTSTCMLTHFAVTLSDIHTDHCSLQSFAGECRFENWSSDS
ncbi:TPA: hypothetical protein ACH3X3_005302 [Trebouxia sp. C0006]